MALVGNDLGDAMKAAVDGATAGAPPWDMQVVWRALGTAIVDYIKANAAVKTQVNASIGSAMTEQPYPDWLDPATHTHVFDPTNAFQTDAPGTVE